MLLIGNQILWEPGRRGFAGTPWREFAGLVVYAVLNPRVLLVNCLAW
jgi:hypothetical protein